MVRVGRTSRRGGEHRHRRRPTGECLVEHDASIRSRSPARPRSAAPFAGRRRDRASDSRSSWVASRPSSSLTTPISTARLRGVVDAIWFNQGQVCCAGSRLLVQESVEEAMLEASRAGWKRCASAIRWIRRSISAPSWRPCSSSASRRWCEPGVDEGAEMWQPSWACPAEGYFYPPTLFTNVSPSATIAQVEIFGPVLVAMTFRTPAEAVALANNTRVRAGGVGVVARTSISRWISLRQVKAGHRVDQLHQHVRRRQWIRRLSRERLRPRGRPRGTVRVRRRCRETGGRRLQCRRASAATASMSPKMATCRSRSIDRTPKLYIGGKQARPDSGYSFAGARRRRNLGRRSRRRQSQGHSQRG